MGEAIAVVGMAGRFPGARDLATYWEGLRRGRPILRRGAASGRAERDSMTVEIEGAEGFDSGFFGLTVAEARRIDPQQRVFLECCWQAYEDAGYDPLTTHGVAGVFAGSRPSAWAFRPFDAGRAAAGDGTADGAEEEELDAATVACWGADLLAARVAYHLDLRGPTIDVRAGSATALVAICQACASLRDRSCDLAVAGAVSISVPRARGDGDESPGVVLGSGAAVVLLKRLDEALSAGDRVRAIIRGWEVANEGAGRPRFASAGPAGQAAAVAHALVAAGVEADSIGCWEAHDSWEPSGHGERREPDTLAGDTGEIAALIEGFRRAGSVQAGFCALGTAKFYVGDLEAASGAANFFKAVFALEQQWLPPTPEFARAGRATGALRLDTSPFWINPQGRPWVAAARPRRAGVSSWGVGGVNVHVILEEAPQEAVLNARAGGEEGPQLLVISARGAASLERASDRLMRHLGERELAPSDVAFTLQTGRHHFRWRRAFLYVEAAGGRESDGGEARTRVPTRLLGSGRRRGAPGVVFLLPGLFPEVFSGFGPCGVGGQGIGSELYRFEPVFRAEFDRCAELSFPLFGLDLREPSEASGAVADGAPAGASEAALFAMEWALARLWMHWGVEPAAILGVGVGEFVAACLAGVLELGDALHLIALRGRLRAGAPARAGLAVRWAPEPLRPLLPADVAVAASYAPTYTVVVGAPAALGALRRELRRRQIAVRRLVPEQVAALAPTAALDADAWRGICLRAPRIPYVSSVTGDWIRAEQARAPDHWLRQWPGWVRFSEGARRLASVPRRILLQVGPGRELARWARQALARPVRTLASLPRDGENGERAALLAALGQLWLAGLDPDWPALHCGPRRRVALPGYPFERRRLSARSVELAAVLPGSDPIPGATEDNVKTRGAAREKAGPFVETESPLSAELETAPLTESQREIWLAARQGPEGSAAFNESISLHLEGPLVAEALRGALNDVAARHEALRAVFASDGQRQCFLPRIRLPLPLVDLSGQGREAQEVAIRMILAGESAQPFDLASGPLLRAQLVRLGAERHLLVVTVHHLVCDGWSANVVLEEMGWLYSQRRGGVPVDRLPTPASFPAYARGEAASAAGGRRADGAAAEAYWLEQFATLPPALALPTDRPRGSRKIYDAGVARLILEPSMSAAVRQVGAAHGCTPFVVLLTAYVLHLHELSGQDDIVVGIPAAAQALESGAPLVGHCVHFLPLRCRLRTGESLSGLLARQRQTVLAALEHQQYTYGALLRELRAPRRPGRQPLVEAQFNLERIGPRLEFDGLRAAAEPNAKRFVHFDLFLCAVEQGPRFALHCDYNAGLFEAATIAGWLGRYRDILGEIADTPDRIAIGASSTWKQAEGVAAEKALVRLRRGVTALKDRSTALGGAALTHGSAARNALISWARAQAARFTRLRAEIPAAVHRLNPVLRDAPLRRPAPRHATGTGDWEQRLRLLWEQLLPGSAVGLNDDFFELGGHSLLALRLFDEIERFFGQRYPPSMLFEAPTVARLAQILSGAQAGAGDTTLVPVQAKGGMPPLFIVSGIGGSALRFQPLARRLGEQQPVFALQPPGLDGRRPYLTRVEELAEHYLARIRSRQPRGPYFLAGYSFGGMVSFEMAKRLHERRERVALLAMLDAYEWGYLQRVMRRWGWSYRLRLLQDQWRALRGTPQRVAYCKQRFRHHMAQGIVWLCAHAEWPLPRRLEDIEAVHAFAASRYRPQPYPGTIVVLRTSRGPAVQDADCSLGWKELALGGIFVREIDATHDDVTREPNVAALARELAACLEAARGAARAA